MMGRMKKSKSGTKKKALEILKAVCKKDCEEKMYEGQERIKLDGKTANEIMVEFYEPVEEIFWIMHFGAFQGYLNFLMNQNK